MWLKSRLKFSTNPKNLTKPDTGYRRSVNLTKKKTYLGQNFFYKNKLTKNKSGSLWYCVGPMMVMAN